MDYQATAQGSSPSKVRELFQSLLLLLWLLLLLLLLLLLFGPVPGLCVQRAEFGVSVRVDVEFAKLRNMTECALCE